MGGLLLSALGPLVGGCFGPTVVPLPDFEAGERAAIAAIPLERNGQNELRAVLFTPEDTQSLQGLRLQAESLELYLAYFGASAEALGLEPGPVTSAPGGEVVPFQDSTRALRLDDRGPAPIPAAELPASMLALTRPRADPCHVLQVIQQIEPSCDLPGASRDEPVALTRLAEGRALLLTRRGCFFEVTEQGIRRATQLEASYAQVAPPAANRALSAFADERGRLWIGSRDHTLVEISGDPIDAPRARLHLHVPALDGTQGRHQLIQLDGAPDGSELYAVSLYGDLVRLDTTTATYSQLRSSVMGEGRLSWLGPGRAGSAGKENEVLLYDQGTFSRFALPPGNSASALGPSPDGGAFLAVPRLELWSLRWPGPTATALGPIYAHPNVLLPWRGGLLYVGEAGLVGEWRSDGDCGLTQQSVGDFALRGMAALTPTLLVATGRAYNGGPYTLVYVRVWSSAEP